MFMVPFVGLPVRAAAVIHCMPVLCLKTLSYFKARRKTVSSLGLYIKYMF